MNLLEAQPTSNRVVASCASVHQHIFTQIKTHPKSSNKADETDVCVQLTLFNWEPRFLASVKQRVFLWVDKLKSSA